MVLVVQELEHCRGHKFFLLFIEINKFYYLLCSFTLRRFKKMHDAIHFRFINPFNILVILGCGDKTPWPKATYGKMSLFWLKVPGEGGTSIIQREIWQQTARAGIPETYLQLQTQTRANWKWGMTANSQKPLSSDIFPPCVSISPQFLQMKLPTRDQVFENESPWRTFLTQTTTLHSMDPMGWWP